MWQITGSDHAVEQAGVVAGEADGAHAPSSLQPEPLGEQLLVVRAAAFALQPRTVLAYKRLSMQSALQEPARLVMRSGGLRTLIGHLGARQKSNCAAELKFTLIVSSWVSQHRS